MPTAPRPTRSFVAFALVANLLVASAPVSAGSAASSGAAEVAAAAATSVRAALRDRDASPARARTIATTSTRTIPGAVWEGWISRARPIVPEPKPTAVSKTSKAAASKSAVYRGRNHLWIPALGVNRSVTFYACSSSYYPGNRVYRWGCAGSNNIYLFGHAYSVFKSLHDAYVRGRLFKGMKVYYANGAGNVSTYAVSWWKLTTPDKGAWAYAAQSTPSLTLQTCVGSQSQYRLIVRLRKVA